MTAEEKAASIISKVGLWWPLAEEDQLRRAGGAYEQVATAVLAAAATGSAGAKLVTGGNQGTAFAAFDRHWGQYDGNGKAGLPATAKAASNVATALNEFAAAVDEAKGKITNLAIEIGATIAVGAGLALFTFGTSAGAAAARTAMLVARGLTIAAGLTGVASTIVATLLVGATFGAVEGFVSSIVAQVGKAVLSDGKGISLSETMSWTAWGAGGGAVLSGGGLALRGRLNAVRSGDGILANRLRGVNWADETGAVRLPATKAQIAAANERIAAQVSNPRTLETLRRLVKDPIQLERLLAKVPHPPKLSLYLERLGPDQLERSLATIARTGIPQGMTRQQFLDTSKRLREVTSHLGDDLRITGSRVAGAARGPGSDLDVTVRVSPERFDELAAAVPRPAEGTNAARRLITSVDKGKLDQRLLSIPGLGEASTSLTRLSGLQKVRIAVIREGSKFDHGPWIRIPK